MTINEGKPLYAGPNGEKVQIPLPDEVLNHSCGWCIIVCTNHGCINLPMVN